MTTFLPKMVTNPLVHATIDLETLDTKTGAVVFEIGAGILNTDTCVATTKCWTMTLQDVIDLGTVSASTLAWWMTSPDISQAVRDRLAEIWNTSNRLSVTPSRALHELNTFLISHAPISVWANGAAFDFPIVRSFYDAVRLSGSGNQGGRHPVWGFSSEMCLRPLRRMFPEEWRRAQVRAAVRAERIGMSGSHAADYDCLTNLLFLETVNEEHVSLIDEETRRAAANQPSS